MIAVIGNPNTGKSTLFNALTGLNQKVGNYPGVTVEKHVGDLTLDGRTIQLVDLPGVYSLAAHSPDELIALDILLGRVEEVSAPDAVLVLVDATNLTRNLFLATQILELGVPVVIALNMMDRTASEGLTIDSARLSDSLGAPVVEIVASTGDGISELKSQLIEALGRSGQEHLGLLVPLKALASSVASELGLSAFDVERALIDVGGAAEARLVESCGEAFGLRLAEERMELAPNQPLAAVEARERYGWITRHVGEVTERVEIPERLGQKLERFVAHPFWGTVLFVGLMATIFQAVFAWATPLMDLIDGASVALGGWIEGVLPPGAVASLLVDGVVAGVGKCRHLPASDPDSVRVYYLPRGHGVYGTRCLLDGSANEKLRPFRAIVYPDALEFCLCGSRDHGDARYPKPPRPFGNHVGGSVHDLFGSTAGLRTADLSLRTQRALRLGDCESAWFGASWTLPSWDSRWHRDSFGTKEDPLKGADTDLSDGAPPVPASESEICGDSVVGTQSDLSRPGRNRHLHRGGRGLGAGVLSTTGGDRCDFR